MRRTSILWIALLWIALLALLATGLPPQKSFAGRPDCVEGSGVVREEARALQPFSHLAVSGVYQVRVKVGPAQRVRLRGDDNILPHIRTEVHDGKLTVDSDRSLCLKTDLRLEIDVPRLTGLESGGTVDVEADGIHGDRFALKLDGTGNARLSGQCERFEAALMGASELRAEQLRAQTVVVALEGAGSAAVHADQRLDAVISGLGTVTYSGDPEQINPRITGLGELIAR